MPKTQYKNTLIDSAENVVEVNTDIIDPLARLKALFFIIVTIVLALFQQFTIAAFVVILAVIGLLYLFFSIFGLT